MSSEMVSGKEYTNWLESVKSKVRLVQIRSAIKVNSELLHFYWELGADIVAKQTQAKWGEGFLPQLSKDLMSEFPDVKGFSLRNLKYVKQWYLFYNQDNTIGQQAVAQLSNHVVSHSPHQKGQQPVAQITRIPWGHNLVIVTKCKHFDEALYYVQNTIVHGWSRSVLTHQIESGLWQREGKAITNFPKPYPQTSRTWQLRR